MRNFMTVTFAIICSLGSVLAVLMGFDWIEGNIGLHPMLAGAIATLLMVMAYVVPAKLFGDKK